MLYRSFQALLQEFSRVGFGMISPLDFSCTVLSTSSRLIQVLHLPHLQVLLAVAWTIGYPYNPVPYECILKSVTGAQKRSRCSLFSCRFRYCQVHYQGRRQARKSPCVIRVLPCGEGSFCVTMWVLLANTQQVQAGLLIFFSFWKSYVACLWANPGMDLWPDMSRV